MRKCRSLCPTVCSRSLDVCSAAILQYSAVQMVENNPNFSCFFSLLDYLLFFVFHVISQSRLPDKWCESLVQMCGLTLSPFVFQSCSNQPCRTELCSNDKKLVPGLIFLALSCHSCFSNKMMLVIFFW